MLSVFMSGGGTRSAPTDSVRGGGAMCVTNVHAGAQRDQVLVCLQKDRGKNGLTHLQSDGSWEAGESPGTFVSLLTKHALLTPWSCLSVGALLGDQS